MNVKLNGLNLFSSAIAELDKNRVAIKAEFTKIKSGSDNAPKEISGRRQSGEIDKR